MGDDSRDADPQPAQPPRADRRPFDLGQLRRRVPFYLLVLGLALLVMRYYQRQPSEIVVAYHLGGAAEGLEQLRASYRHGSEEVGRVTLNFTAHDRSTGGAPREHTLRLPDGDYEVEIDLRYRASAPPRMRRISRPVASRTVRMRRPLLVRGSGRVSVLVGDDG